MNLKELFESKITFNKTKRNGYDKKTHTYFEPKTHFIKCDEAKEYLKRLAKRVNIFGVKI